MLRLLLRWISVGVASSSVTLNVAEFTVNVASPSSSPLKVTVASASSIVLLVGETVLVTLAERCPAGIEMVKSEIEVMPTVPGVVGALTLTFTVSAVPKVVVPPTVAVTVTEVEPALSVNVVSLSDRDIEVGRASSSLTVTATVWVSARALYFGSVESIVWEMVEERLSSGLSMLSLTP